MNALKKQGFTGIKTKPLFYERAEKLHYYFHQAIQGLRMTSNRRIFPNLFIELCSTSPFSWPGLKDSLQLLF